MKAIIHLGEAWKSYNKENFIKKFNKKFKDKFPTVKAEDYYKILHAKEEKEDTIKSSK